MWLIFLAADIGFVVNGEGGRGSACYMLQLPPGLPAKL
jgi:hypothetical protein